MNFRLALWAWIQVLYYKLDQKPMTEKSESSHGDCNIDIFMTWNVAKPPPKDLLMPTA